MGVHVFFMLCYTLLYVLASFAIILMVKIRAGCFTLFDFLMPCDFYCSVATPRGTMGCLQCVIVVFPDHSHLLIPIVKLLRFKDIPN